MSTITTALRINTGWIKRLFRIKPTKDRVGRWGEQRAKRHLVAAGIIPITSNWRGIAGEIDLIALDKRTIVIVEVKTRHTSLQSAHPAISAITPDKRERLERLGRSFIRNHGPFCRRYAIKTRRTDVIEVYYLRSRWGRLKSCKIHWHKGIALSP